MGSNLEYGQKSKDSFCSYKEVYDNFPETQEFIDKAYVEEFCKENISVDEIFFSINNDCQFFSCMMLLWFSMVCYEIHYFILYLVGLRSF